MNDQLPTCLRCGWPQVYRPDDPALLHLFDASTIHAAVLGHKGLCLECSIQFFLWTTDGFRWAIEKSGPMFLLLPQTHELLSGFFDRAGTHIDMKTINWRVLIRQWDLPWPKGWTVPTDGVQELR